MPAADWTLLGTWGVFEYWLAPDGVNVHRRKSSPHNVMFEGIPMGARWDSSLAHFETYVAARLAV